MAVAVSSSQVVGVQVPSFNGAAAPLTLYTVPPATTALVQSIRYKIVFDTTPAAQLGHVFEYRDRGGTLLYQAVPGPQPAPGLPASNFTLESMGIGITFQLATVFDNSALIRRANNDSLATLWLDEGATVSFNSLPNGGAGDQFSGMYLLVQETGGGGAFVDVPVYLVPEPMGVP